MPFKAERRQGAWQPVRPLAAQMLQKPHRRRDDGCGNQRQVVSMRHVSATIWHLPVARNC